MRSDDLTMLFPLGLEAPSPGTASRTGSEPAWGRDPGPREPRSRRSPSLGIFLLCPFREAVCAASEGR